MRDTTPAEMSPPTVRPDAIVQAVAFAAKRFLEAPWDEAIQGVLARLGEATGASRTYLFENRRDERGRACSSMRHEWVAEGIAPQVDDTGVRDRPWIEGGFGRWAEILGRGEIVCGPVQSFPESEQLLLRDQSIRSMLVAPIFVGPDWWGTIGFDHCRRERAWSPAEIDALRTAADTLGAAILRGRAEQQLQRSEVRFRTLVERLPAVVYVNPVEDRAAPTYISPRYLDLLGYTAEERMADPDLWEKLLHPEDRERILESSGRSKVTGDPFREEYRMRTRDGRTIWVREESIVLAGDDGTPLDWLGFLWDITQRKEGEERLREAEARFRWLVEELPAVVYVYPAEGRAIPTYISPRYVDLLGYAVEERMADPGLWDRLLHPQDRERILESTDRSAVTGDPFREEYRMRTRDGRTVWVREESVLLAGDDRTPPCWIGFMWDMTQRKEAEEALRQAEHRFRVLVENIPAVAYREAPGGSPQEFYIGPQVKELFGYEPEEWRWTQDFWVDRLHPDDRERVLAVNRHSNETGEPFSVEYRLRMPDGSYRWIHEQALMVREGSDRGYWQGFMQDIDERKRAEQAARRSEERYQRVVEAAADAVLVASPDGTLTALNPAFEAITGLSRSDWIGKFFGPLFHPQDLPVAMEVFQALVRGEAPPPSFELRLLTSGGDYVSTEFTTSTLVEDGEVVGAMGIVRDVTERKRAQEQLERALEAEREATIRLRNLDEMKDTFLRAVSHDLRTPLAAILGLAVTLERTDMHLEPADATRLANRIAANARKLDRMVVNILDLDRIQRGVDRPHFQPTDLSDLVREFVADSEALAGRSVEVRAEPAVVEVDPIQVERILENLVANAVRHTPDGSRVWVRVEPAEDGATLAVEDEGAGVPEEHRRTIFEPFRQGWTGAGSPRQSAGMGVGLALVARFAELHGGRAWVQDREGGGASFRVFLPRGERAPASASPAPGSGAGGPVSLRS